jgi:oligosaccharide repeat unit polymerase
MKNQLTKQRTYMVKGGGSPASLGLLLVSLVVAVYALVNILSGVSGGESWSFEVTAVTLIWSAFYLAFSYLHHKTIYLYATAYLLCLFMFHMGLTVQHAFGVDFAGEWARGPFTSWLELAGWYTVLAMASFGSGYAISAFTRHGQYVSLDYAVKLSKKVKESGRWSSYGLFVASAIFFVWAISSYGNLLDYARHDIFRSDADSRGFGVFMMVFPGATWLYLLSAESKKQYVVGLCLVSFSFLLFMLSGYRSAALFSSLIGVIAWVKTGRKLPIWVAVSGIIFILFAISFVGILRTMGAYGELGANEFEKSAKQADIRAGVSTMGQTAGVLAHVLSLVPEVDEHRYGSSYLFAIRDAIPNIGLNIDDAYSREKLKQEVMSDPRAVKKMVPSDWLTFRILRDQYDLGQGVGFTAIGEAYLNFGVAGAVIFFALLGFFLGRVEDINLLLAPKLFIFVGAILWPLIRTVRNDFSNFTKPAMFMLIILILWWAGSYFIFGKRLSKKNP